MFPQQPQQQFRTTNANVQLFYAGGAKAWNKPPGCSQIYMMLIGGGGNAGGSNAGGSGAVTTWWGSAQNVPDNLVLSISSGNGANTSVNYYASNGLNALLTANGAAGSTAGAAMAANQFTASGFFQSIAGQAGGTGATVSASTTTFLSAGAKGDTGTVNANYGYSSTGIGIFQLQPIIVGVGTASSATGVSGFGCGAALPTAGNPSIGGPGLVIIAAW